eukprot:5653758-Amphidinium_carterae.1
MPSNKRTFERVTGCQDGPPVLRFGLPSASSDSLLPVRLESASTERAAVVLDNLTTATLHASPSAAQRSDFPVSAPRLRGAKKDAIAVASDLHLRGQALKDLEADFHANSAKRSRQS